MGNPLDKFISFETLKTLSGWTIPGSFAGYDHGKNRVYSQIPFTKDAVPEASDMAHHDAPGIVVVL